MLLSLVTRENSVQQATKIIISVVSWPDNNRSSKNKK